MSTMDSAKTTSSTPTTTVTSPESTGHLARGKERPEGSSSPILRRPSNSSSPTNSPASPSLTASPLSLSPNLSENSTSMPSTNTSASESSSGSSSPKKEANDHSKYILCSSRIQPFSPMYFYVPSKDQQVIPIPVSDAENLSFCYYNNVDPTGADVFIPRYYHPSYLHLSPLPINAIHPPILSTSKAAAATDTFPASPLFSSLREQETSFISAEGKELQRIAAERFRDANGWVPRELMYRTKMCSFFYHTGKCAKGDRCNFSHTFVPGMEVPPVPPKKREIDSSSMRTKPCKFYFIYGRCAKGKECNFSHDPMIFMKSGGDDVDGDNGKEK